MLNVIKIIFFTFFLIISCGDEGSQIPDESSVQVDSQKNQDNVDNNISSNQDNSVDIIGSQNDSQSISSEENSQDFDPNTDTSSEDSSSVSEDFQDSSPSSNQNSSSSDANQEDDLSVLSLKKNGDDYTLSVYVEDKVSAFQFDVDTFITPEIIKHPKDMLPQGYVINSSNNEVDNNKIARVLSYSFSVDPSFYIGKEEDAQNTDHNLVTFTTEESLEVVCIFNIIIVLEDGSKFETEEEVCNID